MAEEIKKIFELSKHKFNNKDKALINKAFKFAKKAHANQKRDSGELYFSHVFETAKNLASWGMDAPTISAGLLHDTIEDTDTIEADIKKEFGPDVAFLVKGITKIGLLKYSGVKGHVKSLQKLFMASVKDVRVIIIKLADRLHNIRTLKYKTPDKQKKIALETIEIYAPLANRLGIGNLKSELEECSFSYAYPKKFVQVKKILEEKSNVVQKYLERVAKTLRGEFKNQKIKIVKIDFRTKNKYSFYKKLIRYKNDIHNIHDIVVLRIVVSKIEDCYKILGIVHTFYKPLLGKIKDYISTPKPNGYQGLHTTVLFGGNTEISEVQISTKEMYNEAKYGILWYFLNKGELGRKKIKFDKKIEWVNGFKDLEEITKGPKDFLKNLKTDFFQERIFVFTPKCKMVDLPEGSSPIDFAYAINPNVGNHAKGVKINGELNSLSIKLQNGDMVEIIKDKKAHPSNKWLNFSKTAIAKKYIEHYLQET